MSREQEIQSLLHEQERLRQIDADLTTREQDVTNQNDELLARRILLDNRQRDLDAQEAAASNSNTRSNQLSCEIVQKRPAIVKYYGRLGSKCQDLETFITSVDTHLANLNWNSQTDILNEAKSYLDLSKGDLHNFVSTVEYRSCTDWLDLKKYLRKLYGVVSSRDPVIALQKMIREEQASHSDYITFGGEVNAKTNSWMAMLRDSHWVDQN